MYSEVEALQTLSGAYGIAHTGDVISIRTKDAEQLEKAGLVKIVGEAKEPSIAESGSLRIADETGTKEKAEAETDPANPTGEKVQLTEKTEKNTKAGPTKGAKGK